MIDDAELLRRFATEGDEVAFGAVVARHVGLVYASALRQLHGDAHLAQDVTQTVFTDLARKARALAGRPVLAGWLFTSTRFAAAKVVRSEQRRRIREREAQLMHEPSGDSRAAVEWDRVRAVLDVALASLSARDRAAILLRYFERRDYRDIGARFRVSDNTARMRVERALDRLRANLARHGVTSTAAALAASLGAESVVAAPPTLAATVAGAALAGAASASWWSVFMGMTNVHLALGGACALATLAGLGIQAGTNARLGDDVARLQSSAVAVDGLRRRNTDLRRAAAEVTALRSENDAFRQLGSKAGELKARLDAVSRARATRAAAKHAIAAGDSANVDRMPTVVAQLPPKYPMELRRAGVEGRVVVDLVVDERGAVRNATVVESSDPAFDSAALESVQAWRFEPGVKGGRAVNTHLRIPILFSLHAGAPGVGPESEQSGAETKG